MRVNKAQLEPWLRYKVEVEALGDAQIAAELGVGGSTINTWRHKFGIRSADKFRRKFLETYGKDAIILFQQMVADGCKLATIGVHFGFTREYARQVYNKLYLTTITGNALRPRVVRYKKKRKVKQHG